VLKKLTHVAHSRHDDQQKVQGHFLGVASLPKDVANHQTLDKDLSHAL
jgi:hypothetical protein